MVNDDLVLNVCMLFSDIYSSLFSILCKLHFKTFFPSCWFLHFIYQHVYLHGVGVQDLACGCYVFIIGVYRSMYSV